MNAYINFEKNILPIAIKIIVPAYILQTMWMIPWKHLDNIRFIQAVYGIIFWLFSLMALRMACEWFLMSFNAFTKFLNKD